MKQKRYSIGIDPDLQESGYAIWDRETGQIVEYGRKDFWDLVKLLSQNKDKAVVVVEAGWLNKKVNWHYSNLGTRSEKIAYRVGQNHTIGMLIVLYCEKEGIEVMTFRPKRKKVDGEEFKRITGIKKRMNQDVRDAILMVFNS